MMRAELELTGKDLRTVVTSKVRAGEMAQLVKELPYNHEDPNLAFRIHIKKKKSQV